MTVLPPGPRTPRFWQTFRFLRQPYAYSKEMVARYGEIVRVAPLNGKGVAVASPEGAKIVFAADPDDYETVPALGELFGVHSLLATHGAKHRRQRKLLNPRFHGQRVKSFLATMQRVTRAHFDETLSAAARNGGVVVMTELTQRLTLDVILETVFGESEELDRDASRRVLVDLVAALSPLIVAAPFLRTWLSPPWRKFRRARAAFDAFVDRMVAQRRARRELGGDILGVLLEARYEDGEPMADDEIRDQLFTLLIAGHETTAVTLAWAVYWLLREPRVLARLREELGDVGAPEAIVKLPYLEAVCSEALRIEPVVSDIVRVCKKPLSLGEYTVPAGEIVFVNLAWILRSDRVYAEPLAFRPERFLEKRYGPSEFVPFGGGQRRCLGAAFAESELAIALATIARDWDLEPASDEPEVAVRRNVTMGPKHGVRIRVLRRRHAIDVSSSNAA